MDEQPALAGRIWIGLGAASALLAVAFGAFGAHALHGQITPDRLAIFQTGAHYHLLHSIALILLGAISGRPELQSLPWTGRLLAAGIVLFSGSLYLLAVSGIRAFGAITPLGGLCFLSGWGLLAYTGFRIPRSRL